MNSTGREMDSSLDIPASKRQRTDSRPTLSQHEKESAEFPGLPECREMDAALASVACARITDVNPYLLDGILHHVDFFNLLDIRRVCRNWHGALSRQSAPFLKQVAMDLTSSYLKRLDVTNSATNMWQFVKKAKTVFFFGGTFDKTEMKKLLEPYEELVTAQHQFLPIQRVTFARTTVSSLTFRHVIFQRAGVQIKVYKSVVKLEVHDVFQFRTVQTDNFAQEFNRRVMPVTFLGKSVFVMTREHLASAVSMKKKERKYYSPATNHFAMRIYPFDQNRVKNMRKNIRAFPARKLEELVLRLLKRFGQEDQQHSMLFLLHHNEQEFIRTAPPMMTILLCQYLKVVRECKQANAVAVQPQEPQQPQE